MDVFMLLDGITGESLDKQFPKSVELTSVAYGAHASAPAGATGALGTPMLDPVVVTKIVDSASLGLVRALLEGTHIASGRIFFRRAFSAGTSLVFLELDMTGVRIRAVTAQEQRDDELLAEQVSLSFDTVTWIYTPVTSTGTPGTKITYTYKLPVM